jgi:hypothetical protein
MVVGACANPLTSICNLRSPTQYGPDFVALVFALVQSDPSNACAGEQRVQFVYRMPTTF